MHSSCNGACVIKQIEFCVHYQFSEKTAEINSSLDTKTLELLWFNPSQQQSTMQLLTHSSPLEDDFTPYSYLIYHFRVTLGKRKAK